MLKNTKLWIALGLVPQYVLVRVVSQYPEFIEHYYSQGLYTFISACFRYALGWIPFSFGDILYTLTTFYVLRWFFVNRNRWRRDFKNRIIDILSAVSLFYFAFHVLWGFNYYRVPLHQQLNLGADYSSEQLISVTEKLITKTNALHLDIAEHDSLKINLPYTKRDILSLVSGGYDNLKPAFPHLEYHPKSIKRSLYSYPLTYMGFSGYLNPFTNEAQIDGIIPIFKFPTTASHEIAHQLGYAAENEANFIGFLAASSHENTYFKYCGYAFALRFCLNEIFMRDACLFEDMAADVNPGILKNYKETREFWEAHENPLEPFFKLFYGHFLKANNQHRGMESYSYVVALLVNYFGDKDLV